MPLNASGPISLAGSTAGQSISNEFRSLTTSTASLSQYYRGGTYVGPHNSSVAASGAISLGSFYNAQKRYPVTITISSNTTNYNLQTSSVSGYSASWTDLTLTINAGVTVSGTSSNGALMVSSGFNSADTIHINNSGTIQGGGGAGGAAANGNGGIDGINLNPASSANIRITNNSGGVIGGGGGGGGSGMAVQSYAIDAYGTIQGYTYSRGGGGGGGAGSPGGSAGGTAGTGSGLNNYTGSAGSGGAGSSTSGGAGGAADDGYTVYVSAYYRSYAGVGGAGGARGASGSSGGVGGMTAPGYAQYNQSPTTSYTVVPYPYSYMAMQSGHPARTGGPAGNAIKGTAKYSTPIVNNGTIYGPQVSS
jgi:hypothetical protein